MLMTDFLNAIQSILLLRIKLAPGDAAKLISDHSSKMDHYFVEGYAPIEVVSVMVGRELSENFDVRTGASIETQLQIDPETGKPYVRRVR